jgi:hypothetical protein
VVQRDNAIEPWVNRGSYEACRLPHAAFRHSAETLAMSSLDSRSCPGRKPPFFVC